MTTRSPSGRSFVAVAVANALPPVCHDCKTALVALAAHRRPPIVRDMTFSIVARDPATGDLAVGVASKFLAVGSVVSHAEAGVGAVATQALANFTYGANGLASLRGGVSAAETVQQLTEADEGR